MANHKSAEKRIRQTEKRKIRNKYSARSTRSAVKDLMNAKTKEEASEMLPKVSGMLDKLAKQKVIHKNKASNLKSQLSKQVNKL